MHRRHENELLSGLEKVSSQGWAFIEWWKLYLWYEVEKIRKEPYRDIKLKWEEVGDGGSLYVRETPGGLLLLDGEPVDVDTKT